MIDLHMHSTASDGSEKPAELIDKCAKLRLSLCSVTDHDTIDSQAEARAEAKARGVNYISGIEFSVRHTGELHILGYGIEPEKAPDFLKTMEELRDSRVGRVVEIIQKLGEHGININFEEVERFAEGNTLGRPHVALALMERGYASDMQDAFTKYLNEEGLCYVQRRKLTAKQALELIISAGGTPVLAHPKFIRTDDIAKLVRDMTADGLMGIEAYYPAHSDADVAKFLKIARENKLMVTAGSDYHGRIRPYVALACEKRGGPMLDEAIAYLKGKYVKA